MRHWRRNFTLGVLNGALFQFSNTLISPFVVLPLFVTHLTDSKFLVGLLPFIRQGGWFLPQLVVSRYIQSWPYKKRFYSMGSAFRVASIGLLVVATFTIRGNPSLLLAVFFFFLALFSLGGGVTGLAFMDIVAKAIPITRRGTFFGGRNFWGAFLSFAGGFLVKYMLDRPGCSFPKDFGLLFSISFVALGVAVFLFTQVVEPRGPAVNERVGLSQQFRWAFLIARRDVRYHRFLFMRICLMAAAMATPFYIVYARERLGIPTGMAGLYISAMTIAGMGSNVIWSRISDQRSNKLLIQLSSLVGMSVPLLALSIPYLSSFLSPEVLGYLFGVVFMLLGVYTAGTAIGNMAFLLEISPLEERPIYVGFANTVMGVAMVTSAVGGVVVEVAGFGALFSIALCFFGLALALSLGISDPREGGVVP